MSAKKKYNEVISKITDIHTHYGPFGENDFSVSEILEKFMKIGYAAVGIMPTPQKDDNEIPDNHKVLEFMYQKAVKIIPILMTSPAMIKQDPEFKKVADIPYKIIKIHPYAHNWQLYPDLLEIIMQHAASKHIPIMLHTGYDESEPKNFEKYFAKYSTTKFILAHCKPAAQSIELKNKYSNVWIDISFADISEIHKIITKTNSDASRFLYATDMPINEMFYDMPTIDYVENRIFEIIEKFGVETVYNWGVFNITALFDDD